MCNLGYVIKLLMLGAVFVGGLVSLLYLVLQDLVCSQSWSLKFECCVYFLAFLRRLRLRGVFNMPFYFNVVFYNVIAMKLVIG